MTLAATNVSYKLLQRPNPEYCRGAMGIAGGSGV